MRHILIYRIKIINRMSMKQLKRLIKTTLNKIYTTKNNLTHFANIRILLINNIKDIKGSPNNNKKLMNMSLFIIHKGKVIIMTKYLMSFRSTKKGIIIAFSRIKLPMKQLQ